MEIVCSTPHVCYWWEITHLVHELKVMAAVELHVNATYYIQHTALKSVYEKSQSIMGGKLFSSYRIVFELAQGPRF